MYNSVHNKEKHNMTDEVIPMDRLAKVYVKIRDRISEITKVYETEVETLKAQQAQVSSTMKDQLRSMGSLSSKTAYGTVSLITKTRYYAMDKDAFKRFVIENDAADLYEQRVAQKNMAEFLDKNPGNVPPGLNIVSEIEVSVRKPTK
jgi:hypothetical protein